MRTQPRWVARTAAGGSVAALLAVVGCGLMVTPTYPVHGKVVYRGDGNVAKLAGGRVYFESAADPRLTGSGELAADGGFVAGCFLNGQDRIGLPAGDYRVYLQPPPDETDARTRAMIVPARYRMSDLSPFALTVAAGDNAPTFEIDAGR